jgi:hypothetical protein
MAHVVADGQPADDPGDHEEQTEDLDEEHIADASGRNVLAGSAVGPDLAERLEDTAAVRSVDGGAVDGGAVDSAVRRT